MTPDAAETTPPHHIHILDVVDSDFDNLNASDSIE